MQRDLWSHMLWAVVLKVASRERTINLEQCAMAGVETIAMDR